MMVAPAEAWRSSAAPYTSTLTPFDRTVNPDGTTLVSRAAMAAANRSGDARLAIVVSGAA
jgi:hypothetical protein